MILIETEVFGFYDKQFGSQLSFVLVGLWWLGFAQITYAKVAKRRENRNTKRQLFWKGLKKLKKLLKNYLLIEN